MTKKRIQLLARLKCDIIRALNTIVLLNIGKPSSDADGWLTISGVEERLYESLTDVNETIEEGKTNEHI